MIDDPLERLRRANPVPREVPAPPLESVLRRLQDGRSVPLRRAPRFSGVVVTALGVGAAIMVAVLAIVLPGHHTRPPANRTTSVPATPLLPTPRFGMLGQVEMTAAQFPTPSHGVVLLQQCHPCGAGDRGGPVTNWVAITDDAGTSWHVRKILSVSAPLANATFNDAGDGWARGGFVTHDGGLTWKQATAATPWPVDTISVARGKVWALAYGCAAGRCGDTVLNGPVAGSTLTRVARQPLSSYAPASILAAGANTAYIAASRPHGSLYLATHDGGRTWQTLPRFCPVGGGLSGTLVADSPTSLWQTCPGRASVPGRSSDGGLHWRTFHGPAGMFELQPVSSQVAWAASSSGDISRTTDGGATWQTVWSARSSQNTLVKGAAETLSAEDAQTAEVTVLIPPVKGGHTQGSYVVVYRTSDGGRTWPASIVLLPRR